MRRCQRVRDRGGIARHLATGVLVLMALLGCQDQGTTPVATTEPAGSATAQEQAAGPRVAERPETNITKVREAADPAKQLFESLVARYRRAAAYSDRARVRLSYRQNGVPQTDTAPLSVQYVAPDRLQLRAYTLQMLCDRGRLTAQVTDPLSSDLDNQRLQQQLPPGRLTLDAIYADPLLVRFATAGLGGPPPQLELLFGERPLEGLFDDAAALSLLGPSDLEGQRCERLRIQNRQTQFVIWIDHRSGVIRRIELPLTMVPGLVDDLSIEDARLSIEFTEASFQVPAAAAFQLDARRSPAIVERFIPPPPPLSSPLLGQPPAPFRLTVHDAASQRLGEVTTDGSDRPLTVLMWIARHEGSQAAAVGLQEIVNAMPETLRKKTRVVLVMAEPGEPTATTLQRWNVQLDWANDTQAVGRDVFGVEAAPSLCVLGPSDRIEWFQHRAAPGALLALPQVLTDLAAGAQVGETLVQEAAANQRVYRETLASGGRAVSGD